VSFTPLEPTGFDPCGVAFGAVRKPYSAPCTFFSDLPTSSNRIRWYIVPDNTPAYDGPTVFWPRVDVPADQALTVHEKEGAGRNVRKFWRGIDFWGYPADHVHGDVADFMGKSLSSKYAADRPCEGPVLFGWIFATGRCLRAFTPDDMMKPAAAIGGTCNVGLTADGMMKVKIGVAPVMVKENPIIEWPLAGFKLAADCIDVPIGAAKLPAGIALAGVMKPAGQLAEQLDAGLAVAGYVTTPAEDAEQLDAGLAVAGYVTTPAEDAEQLDAGLAVAGYVTTSAEDAEQLDAGLAVAGYVTTPAEDAEQLDAGLAVAGEVTGDPPSPEMLAVGAALAGEVTEEPGGGSSEGSTACETATPIIVGQYVTSPFPESGFFWWKIDLTGGVQYHLSAFFSEPGLFSTIYWYSGTCASPTQRLSLSETGCGSYTPSSNETMLIKLQEAMMGDGTIEFVIDIGPCP